jgi:hypothetical protein
VALGVYKRAEPPSVGEFRRLQHAELNRTALARAVESGMSGQGSAAPAWFVKRKQSGRVTSVEAERELLVMVWAVRGILPEATRAKFDQELIDQWQKIDPTDRETIARIAAAILPQ